MAVSVSTSYTTSTRDALSNNMQSASMSATKMSTGLNFIHAYEDPTGIAIGLSMAADQKVLEIVFTGIKQTQSMLYIAEEGMKAIYETVSKLNGVLAKAKLGNMTDELVKNTLSPTYIQLKQEIDRIADSIDFNGQKLLNGSGGKKIDGTAATVPVTPSAYVFSDHSATKLTGSFGLTGLNVDASFGGAAAASATMTYGSNATVIGGSISEAGGDVTIEGATVVLSGVVIDDGGTNTATADLTLKNVTLVLTGATFASGDFSSSTVTITPSTNKVDYAFSNFTTNTGTVSDVTVTTAATTMTGTTNAVVDSVTAQYALSGGKSAASRFNFVTGTDLNDNIVEVEFPNMRLTSAKDDAGAKILGMIETINVSDNISAAVPTDLTNLTSVADADIDIPLVQAMADKIITYLDTLGGYQERLINIQAQVGTSIQQVDNAKGEILNADLAKENENFTRSSVQVNIAISVLSQLNNFLKSLERLVQ